jgi:hypothetical protein
MARLSVQKRFSVLKRDNFTCQYCGKAGGRLEVDHVKPICQGGSNEMENLKTACFECNRGKTGARLDQVTTERRDVSQKIKYAIHVCENGTVDWVGEIVEMSAESISCEVIDAVFGFFGKWYLSGEIRTEPATEWRLFTDRAAALKMCHRINEQCRSALSR